MQQPNVTPRDRFITALKGGWTPGRTPHFELVFFLTMEVFGKVHPSCRSYHQWDQMGERERQLHREDVADVHIATARQYDHSAIFVHMNPNREDEFLRAIDIIRDKTGDEFFLMIHGDATMGIPGGANMMDYVVNLVENRDQVLDDCAKKVDDALARGERFAKHGGLDGFALCADYCFNDAPFLSPDWFGDFVTPFLTRLVRGYRDMGLYSIKHTDGNIMPILDQLVEGPPDALHSLDPQAGVDIAEVKRRVGDRVALVGNVNCGLLDTGTDEECAASARYALQHGMPGGGYIFSTSNCVYTGMALRRYELIHDVWRREGVYNDAGEQVVLT